MRDELFQELVESVKEMGGVMRGEREPERTFEISDSDLDVIEIRKNFGLSRTKFAALLGISARTLEGWEQRRREPEGPAKVLLRVAARHPEAVLETVGGKPRKRRTSARTRKKTGAVVRV